MSILLRTIAFSFFLLLFSVEAQRYYGVAGAFSVAGSPVFPVGFQGGNTDILPDFGVRQTVDTVLFALTLGTDALYTPSVASTQFYLGGGPEFTVGGIGFFSLGVRATAGLEYRQDNMGFFAEVQPYIGTEQFSGVRVRTGLNIYLQD